MPSKSEVGSKGMPSRSVTAPEVPGLPESDELIWLCASLLAKTSIADEIGEKTIPSASLEGSSDVDAKDERGIPSMSLLSIDIPMY